MIYFIGKTALVLLCLIVVFGYLFVLITTWNGKNFK